MSISKPSTSILLSCLVVLLAGGGIGAILAVAPAPLITATGTVSGTLNGLPINATYSGVVDTRTGRASVDLSPISSSLAQAMRWTVFNNTVTCLTGATEQRGAINLLSLTDGNFERPLSLTFPTGEKLTALAQATRTGPSTLNIDLVYGGTAPPVDPNALFEVRDTTLFWIQTDSTTVTQRGLARYRVDNTDVNVPLLAEYNYDGLVQLPFDERLIAQDLVSQYDAGAQVMHYEGTKSLAGPGASVPTLSEWAMIALIGLLILSSSFLLYRRKNSHRRPA